MLLKQNKKMFTLNIHWIVQTYTRTFFETKMVEQNTQWEHSTDLATQGSKDLKNEDMVSTLKKTSLIILIQFSYHFFCCY